MYLVLIPLVSLIGGCIGAGTIKSVGPYDWSLVTSLDVTVKFDCLLYNDGNKSLPALPPNRKVDEASYMWQLPGSKELVGPQYAQDNIEVDGGSLSIKGVKASNKGIYMCRVILDCGVENENCTGPVDQWFKHGLNLNGHLYDSMLEKYQMNFIQAGASAGGVLVLFAVLCPLYHFQYSERKLRERRKSEKASDMQMGTYKGNGVDNKGIESDKL